MPQQVKIPQLDINTLLSYINTPIAGVSVPGVAPQKPRRDPLLASSSIPALTQTLNPQNNEDPSILNRLLGYMSIPGYTVDNILSDITGGAKGNPIDDVLMDIVGGAANVADVPLNPVNWIPGVNQGLTSLADKYNAPKTGADLLGQWGVTDNVDKAVFGLGLTVLTDPLSYVGVGLGTKGKAVAEAGAALKGVTSAERAITPAEEIASSLGGTRGIQGVQDIVRKPTVSAANTGLDLAVPGGRSADQLQQIVDRYTPPPPLYHGSGNTLPDQLLSGLDTPATNDRFFGPGLYTTPDKDSAHFYSTYNANSPNPQINEFTPPKNTFDLSQTISNADKSDVLDHLRATGRNLTDRQLNDINNATRWQDVYTQYDNIDAEITNFIKSKGNYDSLKAADSTGETVVLLNPEKYVQTGPNTFSTPKPKYVTPKSGATGRFYNPERVLAELQKVKAGVSYKGASMAPKDIQQFIENLPEIQRVRAAETVPPLPPPAALADATAEVVQSFTSKLPKNIKELSPTYQVILFQDVSKGIKGKNKIARSIQAMRLAEDTLISSGIPPVAFGGGRLRLSDVLQRLKPKTLEELDAYLPQIANRLTPDIVVRAAVGAQKEVRQGVVSDMLSNLESVAAPVAQVSTRTEENLARATQMRDMGVNLMEKAGFTEKETSAVKPLIEQVFKGTGIPMERVMQNFGKSLYTATVRGEIDIDAALSLNNAVEKTLGGSYKNWSEFKLTAGKYLVQNKAVEAFMSRMATNWGRADVFREYQDVASWAAQDARNAANLLNAAARQFSQDEIYQTYKYVQGAKAGNIPDKLQPLAAILTDWWDHALGFKGMDPAKVSGVRANITMKEVNEQLKRLGVENFKFTAKKDWVDANGVVRDFSENGEGWLASWQAFDVKDPLRFTYNMHLALNRSMAERVYYQEMAARWGSPVKTGTHFEKAPQAALKGYYFEPKLRAEMVSMDKLLMRDIWRPNSGAMRFYASMLRHWKAGVTIYLASHHIRNMIGDTWLMWAAGHNNPKYFGIAAKIIKSQRSRLNTTFEQLGKVTGEDSAKWLTDANPASIVFRYKKGVITREQIFESAYQRGLLKSADMIEDLMGTAPIVGKMAPFGGQVHNFASNVSEVREWFVRMAHYTSAVDKKLKTGRTDLAKVYDEAAHEINQWHPDGSDLTDFEKNLRLVIPFYSWQRKVIPLLVQTALQRPAKLLAYPRAQLAAQQAMGIEGGTISDPFPNNQLYPNWLRAYGIGPLGEFGGDQSVGSNFWAELGKHMVDVNGEPYGSTVVNPGTPFDQTVSQLLGFGNPMSTFAALGENTTPAIQIPAELAFGQTLIGSDISSDPTNFIASNIPLVAPFARVFNGFPGIANTHDYSRSGNQRFDMEAFLNILTGAGIRGTGPYVPQAQLEQGKRFNQ